MFFSYTTCNRSIYAIISYYYVCLWFHIINNMPFETNAAHISTLWKIATANDWCIVYILLKRAHFQRGTLMRANNEWVDNDSIQTNGIFEIEIVLQTGNLLLLSVCSSYEYLNDGFYTQNNLQTFIYLFFFPQKKCFRRGMLEL